MPILFNVNLTKLTASSLFLSCQDVPHVCVQSNPPRYKMHMMFLSCSLVSAQLEVHVLRDRMHGSCMSLIFSLASGGFILQGQTIMP